MTWERLSWRPLIIRGTEIRGRNGDRNEVISSEFLAEFFFFQVESLGLGTMRANIGS